ncbi:MAG: hypothetical protein JNK46_05820 [Methylobacteriaceae bacterium]|nr:hypothetical protein [Methylobacteriaceae bacterium]
MAVFGRRAEAAFAQGAAAADTNHHSVAEQIAPDAAHLLAVRLEASRAALERRLERLTRQASDKAGRPIRLAPAMLIPEPCWRGRYGKFLLQALELSPYDPWNVATLPTHPADASLIEAPLHPGEPTHEAIVAVNARLGEIKRLYHEGHEQVEWTNDPADFRAAHDHAIELVKGLAADRLTALYPPEPEAAPTQADAAS